MMNTVIDKNNENIDFVEDYNKEINNGDSDQDKSKSSKKQKKIKKPKNSKKTATIPNNIQSDTATTKNKEEGEQ